MQFAGSWRKPACKHFGIWIACCSQRRFLCSTSDDASNGRARFEHFEKRQHRSGGGAAHGPRDGPQGFWNGSTLRTPADGVPAAEFMFAQFVVPMLSSSASPSFTDASKKAGVEALRQALFSHKADMALLFHQQQYKADTIFIANAAARGGVGSNVVHLALAVLSVMYWMQNERSRSTASISAALAIELLLNDNSFDPNALPTMRQEELTKMTLSQEVISFVTSVNHEDQHLKLNGPEWSIEQQDKRPRLEGSAMRATSGPHANFISSRPAPLTHPSTRNSSGSLHTMAHSGGHGPLLYGFWKDIS